MKLYCATSNPGKLKEFQLAAGDGIEIEPLTGIPPCEENGSTFQENAMAKALYYSQFAPGKVFADDSGLVIDALGGAPGIYSARYAGDDERNNDRVLREMKGVENRAARFVCFIGLAEKGRMLGVFHGTVDGEILHAPQGDEGFGYDPLFYYAPFRCSLAEVPAEKKFAISHRGLALQTMLAFLRRSQ